MNVGCVEGVVEPAAPDGNRLVVGQVHVGRHHVVLVALVALQVTQGEVFRCGVGSPVVHQGHLGEDHQQVGTVGDLEVLEPDHVRAVGLAVDQHRPRAGMPDADPLRGGKQHRPFREPWWW